ncbi:MAG TPA: class I SAM-dependent methyltransferase [Polyangiaceae bacterium]|nr:class I SAM-dependent methyltransferase [Polyangiaceae bacterium]
MTMRVCVVCEAESDDSKVEQAPVRSNVRVFRNEQFVFWRCPRCGSLHARDEVDLAHYYAKYPFHDLPADWRLQAMYGNQLKRLRKAGVEASQRILDYGCGGGQFVKYLRSRGYRSVTGFDEYSAEYGDKNVLADRYDCILSQDVIEHVASPHALTEEFSRLVRPGGIIAVGTPNASAIDIQRAEDFVHTIHAPYHRHILSKGALLATGKRAGWDLLEYYPTMYSNTRIPFLNERFYFYYTQVTDGTLDALMEPVKAGALLLRAPLTLFWGLFGSFFSRGTDVMAVFRRP